MSRETIEWLNNNTMLGNIKSREKYASNNWMILQDDGSYRAWWQTDGYQHAYDGFIPVEEVDRVLFSWEPVEAMIQLRVPCTADQADGMDGDGNYYRFVVDTGSKAIVNPSRDVVYSYVGASSYQIHGYHKWLIDGPAMIADGEIGIDSAGLLRNGGVAYVCMSLPDGVTTNSGVEFRPTLMAVTSLDTTRATGYFITNLVAVCDNSMQAGINQSTSRVKIKHSAKSLTRIHDVRQALGLVYEDAEQFANWVDELVNVDVTDRQFKAIIDGMFQTPDPIKSKDGKITNQRAITIAENKKDELSTMWHTDPRCKQWNGTLFGAFQTFNTWSEHTKPRNDNAIDRVMMGTVSGQFAKDADEFWKIVESLDDTPHVIQRPVGV